MTDWLLENHLYRRSVDLRCMADPLPVGHPVTIELPKAIHENGKVRQDGADVVIVWEDPLLGISRYIQPDAVIQTAGEPFAVIVNLPDHLETQFSPTATDVGAVMDDELPLEGEDELPSFDHRQPSSSVGMYLHILGDLDGTDVVIRGLVVSDVELDDGQRKITTKNVELLLDEELEGFNSPRGSWTKVDMQDTAHISLLNNGSVVNDNVEIQVIVNDWNGTSSLESGPLDAPYTNIPAEWLRFNPLEAFLAPGVETLWVYYGDPQSIDVIDSYVDVPDRFSVVSGDVEFTRPGRVWVDGVSDVVGATAFWRGYATNLKAVFLGGIARGGAKITLDGVEELIDTYIPAVEEATYSKLVGSGLAPDVEHELEIKVSKKTESPTRTTEVELLDLEIVLPSVATDNGEEVNLRSWEGV